MTRTGVYTLLGVAITITAWGHLRGVPSYKDARHYEREVADRPPLPPPSRTSMASLQAEVAALHEEVAAIPDLDEGQEIELESTLEELARSSGLKLERVEVQLRPRRRRGRAPLASREASLRLSANGDFAQVRALLEKFARWDDPARVESFTLSLESNPLREGPLRLELELLP